MADTTYGGFRLRFGPVLSLPATHWIRTHPAGSRISVAYDPHRPSTSVLESGVSATLSGIISLMLLIDGIGIWWIIVLLRS